MISGRHTQIQTDGVMEHWSAGSFSFLVTSVFHYSIVPTFLRVLVLSAPCPYLRSVESK